LSHVDRLAPPDILPFSIPFKAAKLADVFVQVSEEGRADVFIDDIITVGYFSDCWKWLCGAALLALHIFDRPVDESEPVPRDDLLAINKLLSDGSPSEIKIVLGWVVNTRLFTISLPDNKFNE